MRRAVPPRWRDRRGDWAGAPSAERRKGHGLIWIKGRARGRDRTLGRPRRWRGLCATGSLLRDSSIQTMVIGTQQDHAVAALQSSKTLTSSRNEIQGR
jgi:hypothetical protein